MAIKLEKSQGIKLTKEVLGTEESLKVVKFGCGWLASTNGRVIVTKKVPKKRKVGGFLGFGGTYEEYEETVQQELYVGNIDIDASILAFNKGTKVGECTYMNKSMYNSRGNLVAQSSGDDTVGSRGKSKSDNETITINLENAVGFADTLYLVLNIFNGESKGQHFNMIQNSYVRVYDNAGKELAYFDLAEDYDGKTGVVVGKLVETNGKFEFVALGDGLKVKGLRDLSKKASQF